MCDITELQQQVSLKCFPGDVIQVEWADSGETLLFESAGAVGRKSLGTLPGTGGEPTRFDEFGSDQIHSGIGVSPEGAWAAYVSAQDGIVNGVFAYLACGSSVQPIPREEVVPMATPHWCAEPARFALTIRPWCPQPLASW